MIFLKDVDATEMDNLLQFIYLGEVNIPSNALQRLIEIARDLGIVGLYMPNSDGKPKKHKRCRKKSFAFTPNQPKVKTEYDEYLGDDFDNFINDDEDEDGDDSGHWDTEERVEDAAAVAAVAEDMDLSGDTPPGVPFRRHKSDNPVWKHFKKSTKEERAKCDHCGAMLSCKGGTTGVIRNHLKAKHQLTVNFKVKPGTSELSRQGGIEKYIAFTPKQPKVKIENGEFLGDDFDNFTNDKYDEDDDGDDRGDWDTEERVEEPPESENPITEINLQPKKRQKMGTHDFQDEDQDDDTDRDEDEKRKETYFALRPRGNRRRKATCAMQGCGPTNRQVHRIPQHDPLRGVWIQVCQLWRAKNDVVHAQILIPSHLYRLWAWRLAMSRKALAYARFTSQQMIMSLARCLAQGY